MKSKGVFGAEIGRHGDETLGDPGGRQSGRKPWFEVIWLPFVDAYRTFLGNPGVNGRRVLEQLAGLPMSA